MANIKSEHIGHRADWKQSSLIIIHAKHVIYLEFQPPSSHGGEVTCCIRSRSGSNY